MPTRGQAAESYHVISQLGKGTSNAGRHKSRVLYICIFGDLLDLRNKEVLCTWSGCRELHIMYGVNNNTSFEKHTSNAGRHNLRTYVSLGSLDLRNKDVSVQIILC